MPYKRRYQHGVPILTLDELVHLVIYRREFIYLRHKVYHPGFIRSMQLQTLHNAITRGQAFRAVYIGPTEEIPF
jgi:hypothetical protein